MTEIDPAVMAEARRQAFADLKAEQKAEAAAAANRPGMIERIAAWVVNRVQSRSGTPSGRKQLLFETVLLGLVGFLIWANVPNVEIARVAEEVLTWGLKLIGLGLVGIVILLMVFYAFRTMLDSFTVRKEVVGQLHAVLANRDHPQHATYVLAGAIIAGLTMVAAGLIIFACIIAPYI